MSQANVDRLIIGFLSEGLLLLFSHGSNLGRSRRSKNNERDSRIYWSLARAGTWKIQNNLHYNEFLAVASIVLCTKYLRWRSAISVSVTPNNSHSAVVWGIRQSPWI